MSAPQPRTRCLLCSLACPVAFEARPSEGGSEVLTEYVRSDPQTQGRLCFRGHYLAEMAAHPFRLTHAEMPGAARSDAADHSVPTDRAVAEVASRLAAARGRAGVLIDGNLPVEDTAAALHFARDILGTRWAAIHLPGPDLGMLEGIPPGTPMLPSNNCTMA